MMDLRDGPSQSAIVSKPLTIKNAGLYKQRRLSVVHVVQGLEPEHCFGPEKLAAVFSTIHSRNTPCELTYP
ncbi:hypothetical protein Pdw03_5036 [Penicillium digitatum]|uniref:Uncharacterized protein n=1 Tax=Penicillium digitatum TaxID=36651 RepID=A0A7T6XJE8_PENDI|nr:hypothetical protein Pdw03_5036 [Penicillium digitatum]